MIHGWIMKFQTCEQTFHGLLLQYFHLRGFSKTDPLDFAPTRERFGIASIPPITRIANEFFAHSNTGPQVDFSSNKIWLSKLISKQKDNYAFLAFAQQTKYAVIPLHTEDEFNLFHSAVSPGGEYASAHGLPNFDQMVRWWSEKADGKTIFYKLREHLAAYYKTWSQRRQEKQTMLTSQPQRQPHEKRIRSATYVSHVLPAAKRHQPGIINNEMETVSTITEITADQDVLVENEASLSSMSVIEDAVMLDTNAPLFESGLANQDVPMHNPDVHLSELHSMPGPSNDINMQQFVFPGLPLNQPFTPGIYAVWGDEKIKRRRCQVCVQAGRDGKTCKGKNNHKNCEFIKVCNICSLNYFSHSLLMDIDRHDCKKYNKYRASTLKILIVVRYKTYDSVLFM